MNILCYGYRGIGLPCMFQQECDLHMQASFDKDSKEIHCVMMGAPGIKCKRDNPNYKPMTPQQFLDQLENADAYCNAILKFLLELATMAGLVADE